MDTVFVTRLYDKYRNATVRHVTLCYASLRFITLHYASLRIVTLRYALLAFLYRLRYASTRIVTLRHPAYRIVTLRYATLRFVTLRYASYATLRSRDAIHDLAGIVIIVRYKNVDFALGQVQDTTHHSRPACQPKSAKDKTKKTRKKQDRPHTSRRLLYAWQIDSSSRMRMVEMISSTTLNTYVHQSAGFDCHRLILTKNNRFLI